MGNVLCKTKPRPVATKRHQSLAALDSAAGENVHRSKATTVDYSNPARSVKSWAVAPSKSATDEGPREAPVTKSQTHHQRGPSANGDERPLDASRNEIETFVRGGQGNHVSSGHSAGNRVEVCLPGVVEDAASNAQSNEGASALKGDGPIRAMTQQLKVLETRCKDLERKNKELEEAVLATKSQTTVTALCERTAQAQESDHHTALITSASSPTATLPSSDQAGQQTVDAQSKLIAGLESQLQTAAEELNSLRDQFNKRLKKQRAASAELRTEASLTIMHLREDNEELRAQNEKLKNELQALQRRCLSSPKPEPAPGSTMFEEGSELHAMLVAELSQQVTDLNEELAKAKKKIRRLQRTPKHSSSVDAMREVNLWSQERDLSTSLRQSSQVT